MNIKILFINTLYAPDIGGGAEILLQEQAEALKKRGFKISVLTTGCNSGIVKDIVNGITVYRAELKNVSWKLEGLNRLSKIRWQVNDSYNTKMRLSVRDILTAENPDIVICHNIKRFSISVLDEIKLFKTPVIQVLHDLYYACPKVNMFKGGHACKKQCLTCKLFRIQHKSKSMQLDAVVGVSSFVVNKLKDIGYFKEVPSFVIHNARNLPRNFNKSLWKNDNREPLKIGYIGTISRVKGVKWLIEEFMQLSDIRATLTIAGKSYPVEYEDKLKQIASSDKRIKFIGYANSMQFYNDIHLLVIPSIWPDTFPTVAFEACSQGVPVIASNVGGLPEIITDGLNGWLCDPEEPDMLREIIAEAYENPGRLKQFSLNCRESVSEMLDKEGMFDKYDELITQLLN